MSIPKSDPYMDVIVYLLLIYLYMGGIETLQDSLQLLTKPHDSFQTSRLREVLVRKFVRPNTPHMWECIYKNNIFTCIFRTSIRTSRPHD